MITTEPRTIGYSVGFKTAYPISQEAARAFWSAGTRFHQTGGRTYNWSGRVLSEEWTSPDDVGLLTVWVCGTVKAILKEHAGLHEDQYSITDLTIKKDSQ